MRFLRRSWLVAAACLTLTLNHLTSGQTETVTGEYPQISALSSFRPVESSSVCGEDGPQSYCVFTTDPGASLLPNCMRVTCDSTCPFGSTSPVPFDLASLSGSLGTGVSATQGRPGSESSALRFQNSSISIPAASVPVISSEGFSFAAWINQDEGNEGALIAKVGGEDGSDINYALSVNSSSITLTYLTSTQGLGVRTFTLGNLDLSHAYWHHVAMTVFEVDAAFYVNGSVVGVTALDGEILDNALRDIKLGQIATPASSYNGLLQDSYYYSQALTAREVEEVVTGSLPLVHLSTECRCPPSHPLLNPQNQASCRQHEGGALPSRGSLARLNPLAHPAGYLNDLSRTVDWISEPGVREVNITLNLTESLYEVFLFNVQFGSPRPKAAILETSRDGGLTFSPVQYYADDCMLYFDLPDNGPILAADDVNCITSVSSQTPTSGSVLRFRFRDQAVRNFDLNTSPELREFITASHIRLRLLDYFTESTSVEHQYYAIQEVAVAARCACNGHASRCGTEINAVCQCEHNTQGPNCESCLPTHQDKPWRYGTTLNGFPCKPCRCNGHATTCTYDPSVDPFPESYEVGGGGVCQDCQDNTAGANCETCRFGFLRPSDRSPSDPSPCEACGCHPAGITDEGDCVKDQGSGGQILGQCFCKSNVIGLKCDTCRPGFSNLSVTNPLGCSPCGCNVAGTFNSMDTCDAETGQCLCKANVEGLKCDHCRANTTSLDADNPLGCEGCSCDPVGAVSATCDSVTGRCECKPGVTGLQCDQCLPGFTDLSASGCSECACHPSGALDNVCDVMTGACSCLSNVTGPACDTCAPGFYNISAGCVPCDCHMPGSVNGDVTCDAQTGQCNCKTNVQGRTCDSCDTGFTALQASDPDGCSSCDCASPTTDTSGEICDPMTSQCVCSPSSTGLRCETCLDEFYLTEEGCESCECDLAGSSSAVCNKTTGSCTCRNAGVTGRTCDTCLSGFFQFPSCITCGCDEAGAVEGTLCNQTTGTCSCKQYVTGAACDQCVPGFSNLEASNPFGCSAQPDELAPPSLTPSPTSILLTWLPPEVPNGFIQGYNVYRDSVRIATVTGLSYTSEGLQPDTSYSFFIEAFNSAGSTRSAEIMGRTLEGVPSGIAPPILTAVSASSVRAMWTTPTTPNGVITRYELVMVTFELNMTVISELSLSGVVSDLLPFTVYTFLIRACTVTGCGSSETVQVRTLEAPPTFQLRPNVSTLTAVSLFVEWEEPTEPNGVVIQYEVRQREIPFMGSGVFLANVSGDVFAFTVTDLRPFTVYEFSVVAYTAGGGTQSEWQNETTGEAVPEAVQPPSLLPLSSSQLQLTWASPLSPNGVIILYSVFLVTQDGESETLAASSGVTGSAVVDELQPFTEYFFVLEACTAVGCNRSEVVSGFTQESVPSGQPAPVVANTTSSSVSLTWAGPAEPNGVISSYTVLRRAPSLYPSPLRRDVGVAFDGNIVRQFAPSANALGGISNTITFSFRTFSPRGVVLYYINSAGTDYIGVELRAGVPWFFFDAGSGPAVIQPDLSGADVAFNDGLWHSVTATQSSRSGSIVVDGVYSGTGESTGSDQVISSQQVLYVGGIPVGVPRSSSLGLGSALFTLSGRYFAGCLFGLTLNDEMVDFEESLSLGDSPTMADIPGCSVDTEPGVSFLGGGYLSYAPNTINSNRFSWAFDIRTTHTWGLVFFAYSGNSSIAVEMWEGVAFLVISESGSVQRRAVGGNDTCDGAWHQFLLDQSLEEVFLGVDGTGGSLFLQSPVTFSGVFFGGVPMGTPAYEEAVMSDLDVSTPFSGCIRHRQVVDGVTSLEELEVSGQYLVRQDGCPAADVSGSDAACVESWSSVSAGNSRELEDVGLQPWSEYLYRVQAGNSAGTTNSPWIATITEEAAPAGLGTVSLVSQTSSTLNVNWTTPTIPNGLITRYEVTFVPVRTAGLEVPAGETVTVSLSVEVPEMSLQALASELQPATTYSTRLTGYTQAGAGTGPSVELTTDESVPVGVQPPLIVGMGSRELTITWSSPDTPNGLITLYNLYVGNTLVFSGATNFTIVINLLPFREYSLVLEACTSVGCTNSSAVVGQTLPDAPSGLAPPTLTVLSPSSIRARWLPPLNPNGVITRFELRRILGTESSFEVVYVDTDMDLETTITGLLPNTLYTFQLLAFNAGGSVSSPTVQALTLEDIPDAISAPSVSVAGPTYLEVVWFPPGVPNGEIVLYNLTLDGDVVFSTSGDELTFNITDLAPFNTYSLAIIACTVRGCGSSNDSTGTTLEDVPSGYIQPTVLSVTPTSVSVVVNPVAMENGLVTYVLTVLETTAAAGEGVEPPRVVLNSSSPAQVLVAGLVPFTNYSLVLEVSNGAGSLLGPAFEVQTLSTLAEGLAAPTLTLLNATTVLVEWEPPLRPNGIILSYQLMTSSLGASPITTSHNLDTSAVLMELRPFTMFQVSVSVTNTEGETVSDPANITTGETAPSGFDQIVVLTRGPRYLTISWDPPASSNGVLVNYTVLIGGVVISATPPSTLSYNATELLPFSTYNFTVMACTSAGCVESSVLTAMTLEDVPEGISAPFVSGGAGGQPVLVVWTTPLSPNGIVTSYVVERQTGANDSSLVTIATLPGSAIALVAGDQTTRPFTEYSYRVTAANSAGEVRSEFTAFLTPEAAPEGVLPPLLEALSSSVIQVSFSPPLWPQGNITMYHITRTPSSRMFSFSPSSLPSLTAEETYVFNDTDLLPFTNYTYVLRVCTGGGCTDSEPSVELTLEDTPTGVAMPTAVVISANEILIEWAEPSMPSGDIQAYAVFRQSHGFENGSTVDVNCCEAFLEDNVDMFDECSQAASVDSRMFLDSNLDPFSFYSYCVVATNNVASGHSGTSPPTQTSPAPTPLRGPNLNATTLNSTAVLLEWDSLDVAELLGPLDGYVLYVRLAGEEGPGEAVFRGTEQSYVVANLLASTEYVFVVEVSNGVGSVFSSNVSAITEEGIPLGLPAPEVEAVASDVLSVLTFEPQQPNGQIILYNIILDSQLVRNETSPGTYLLEGLLPFTLYTVQVEACTQFGCTRSPLVSATTLESSPVGLGSPFVQVTGPTTVEITWSAPNQPNGNITEYRVLQRQAPSDPPTILAPGLALSLSVAGLRPFTEYSFQVVAENGAGNVTSLPTTVTTLQAPPTDFDPPLVVALSATEILVSWSAPGEINGELFGYQVYRDGVAVLSELTSSLSYLDQDLNPFVEYEYVIEVCAGGGCLNSSAVTNTTLEALPEMVSGIVVSNVGPRSLVLTWEAPGAPNGEITEYIVTQLDADVQVFRDVGFTVTISDLRPFTDYSFHLMVCNSVGCVTSNVTDTQTTETDPEGLDVPFLRNLTSTSVAITWSAPAQPNGVVNTYILRRGEAAETNTSVIIFQGLNTSFNDLDLIADTLYFYTVEAVNGGGGVVSSPSFFRTVPDLAEGISPPVLEVRGPTEISVSWSAPDSPNGEISAYRLFMDDRVVFTSVNQFAYSATGLTPFTTYEFFVEVCNQAGCASSISVSAQTEQALAGGVALPVLTVLGPTAVRVSWTTPTQPNGVITQYEIRRRLLGDIFSETIQHLAGPDILSFPNSGLEPFTSYEYRLRVVNGAGDVFTDWVAVRTSEDLPSGVATPMFAPEVVFSRNVTATWVPPTNPNGVILRYVLEYRLAIDPVTFAAGDIITAQEVPANVTVATATGLSPVTQYEFRVVAINSAGSGAGVFAAVLTSEDVPEGIRPIIVEQRTSFSLVLTWNPPLTPNGVVREYRVLLNGETVYRDLPLTHTITRLQPFTSYNIQLGVCTSAGCSFGSVQSATTAESAPFGQGNPSLLVLASGGVEVSWSTPVQPNGIITRYEVLRQVGTDVSTLIVVHSTSDVANRTFVDTSVSPAETYMYAIRAANSAGSTTSGLGSITTPEQAPGGLSTLVLTTINASSIQVSWLPPREPNGVVIIYRVFRSGGGVQNVSVFSDPVVRVFVDFGLLPFTAYTYVVQACTSAGCGLSPLNIATTSEALPVGLSPPLLRALSESSISVQWADPVTPNGVVTLYNIAILPAQINLELREPELLSRNISNLLPFTDYTVSIEACNSAGCVSSSAVVRTLESTPGFTSQPQVSVVNATSLNVMWSEPVPPNGVIIRYELRRNSTLVFSGTDSSFVDTDLMPSQYYSYTVQAYTSVGAGVESAVSAVVQTPPDTPEGVTTPTLQPTSSTSIRASWTAPTSPNGVIQRYILLVDGQRVFEALGFSFEVTGLIPFTSYSFQLMVCTTTCGSSDAVSAVTLEAPPTGQSPPTLRETNQPLGVAVSWSSPDTPNGIVTRYEVERRLVVLADDSSSMSEFALVFGGSEMSYNDQDPSLRPFTSYEYRVTAINSVGNTTSDPAPISLSEAAPEGVLPPTVLSFNATSVTLEATPPATPNGVIVAYRLIQDGQQVQELVAPSRTFTVTGLQFFTRYWFAVEVCTGGGCTRGANVTQRTGEAPPTGLSSPVGEAVSAREIAVRWRATQQPNGIILSYSLWYRRACPQPAQPRLPNPSPAQCTPGPLLTAATALPADQTTYTVVGSGSDDPLPYTAYEFLVGAANSEGSVNSSFSTVDIVTPQSVPELVSGLRLDPDFTSGIINLEWSGTFRLNGILRHYDLERNGVLLIRNTQTSISLPQEPQNINLMYVVTVFTETGSASANVTTRIEGQVLTTPNATQPPATTIVSSEPTQIPFYEEPAFIVGMVVLGVILLFLLCAIFLCCVRPRNGGEKKGLQVSQSFQVDLDHSHHTPSPKKQQQYSKLSEGSPKRAPVTGSWSPGDPYTKGEIPDIDDPSEIFELSPSGTKKKSYSPSRVESARLLEHDHSNRLSDYVISSPPPFASPKDEDSFRHQQTTFEDTKV